MSTSLVVPAFGIRGYEYTRSGYREEPVQITFTCRRKPAAAAPAPLQAFTVLCYR